MSEATAAARPASVSARYAALEERILDRDQAGASEVYYDLLREGRPLEEMLLEATRIHGPYTHVPYHERIDDGFVNFVNNDHCLLSARATLNLVKMLPPEAAGLAMAQTVWYVPTGLDIWNQKILKAPGHYARGGKLPPGPPPAPVVHWPDQAPERSEGPLRERLGHWLTLVQRGQVLDAYRFFLGLMEEPEHRREALAELVFAGLIDVQDRMLHNRSYTTGHKGYRARSTVELGDAIGWDRAHPVLYAGVLDMAVGPRWYSTYEMACNAITVYVEEDRISAIPYSGTTERERALVGNAAPMTPAETSDLVRRLIREPEPAGVERIAELLRTGKRLRDLLDAIRIGAAQAVIETRNPNNFSMSQHCYQYVSTHGWFMERFEHRHQVKLLFLAAAFLERTAHHQAHTGDMQPIGIEAPAGADRLAPGAILDRLEEAAVTLDVEASEAWTKAYLESGADRAPLVERLALAACRTGNDPHNQEIAQVMLEDCVGGRTADPDRVLIACAHHTAGHRKYGDFLEAGRRFGAAFDVPALRH